MSNITGGQSILTRFWSRNCIDRW